MLTLSTKKDKPISAEAACSILSQHNRLCPIYIDLDRLYEYFYFYNAMTSLQNIKCSQMIHPMRSDVKPLQTIDIIKWFSDNKLDTYMPVGKQGVMSTAASAMRDLLNLGVANEEQVAIIKEFLKLSEYAATKSPLRGVIEDGTRSDKISVEGHRMVEVWPDWATQNTSRFTATNPALGNFTRTVKDLTTVPKGYVQKQVDSGQIEPRITYSTVIKDKQIIYYITGYDDAYYGLLHYVTQSVEEWLSGRTDIKLFEITDDLKAKRQQLKTLGNAVLYGSTNEHGGDLLSSNYIKRIGGHKSRQAFQKDVENRLMSGEYVFETAFGTKIDVRQSTNSQSKYSESQGSGYFNHLVRGAINSYMQGTAADLMRFAIQEADIYLTENARDSYISMSVHDALYYTINEDEYDKLSDTLDGFTAYQVDDWIPIKAEAENGVHRTNPIFADIEVF